MKQYRFNHRFVEFIPDKLEDGVLYVSMAYATVTHKCACGCGGEVVTPLSPTDWQLMFDGEAISLEPSIGNWSFLCRSHYFIRKGTVRWAHDMTQAEIASGRERDRAAKAQHYANRALTVATPRDASGENISKPEHALATHARANKSFWLSLFERLFG